MTVISDREMMAKLAKCLASVEEHWPSDLFDELMDEYQAHIAQPIAVTDAMVDAYKQVRAAQIRDGTYDRGYYESIREALTAAMKAAP